MTSVDLRDVDFAPSSGVTVLAEADLRRCVGLNEQALQVVADAFTWLATGRATMPPILHLSVEAHRGEVDVKTAYVAGLEGFAVKIATGFHDNPTLGLPSGQGLMVVLDARTGRCRAVLLDNGYLTDLRTALAGAVAAQHLAPRQTQVVGVVGTGAQARWQARSLQLVRHYERLLVWGRDPGKAWAFADEMGPRLHVEVEPVADIHALVRRSECVVTTTPSRRPLITADMLHPGLHLTAMGSDGPGKQELAPSVLDAADLLVCDRRQQSLTAGELQHGPAAAATAFELGEFTSGRRRGRHDDDQITVCDLTGTGVQDTAIAMLAMRVAHQDGLGILVGERRG